MEITLDPHGPDHVCAAETDPYRHRRAWINRSGIVYLDTSSREAEQDYLLRDWEGLTEFAREADAALRAAVAGR
jgi:hypothetical protein